MGYSGFRAAGSAWPEWVNAEMPFQTIFPPAWLQDAHGGLLSVTLSSECPGQDGTERESEDT